MSKFLAKTRIAIAVIPLLASALVFTAKNEGYTDEAVIPVKGDRWTKGFGDTQGEDGKGVKEGDVTNPVRAIIQLHSQMENVYVKAVKRCIKVPTTLNEANSLFDASVNAGPGGVCRDLAPIWNKAKSEEDYRGACEAFIGWRETVKGKSCRDRANNCYGLVKRRQYQRNLCLTPDGGTPPALP
jgi:lysozyme